MRILVIDDEGRFRQMLRAWLLKQGHDVHAVDGGTESLELLKRIQYDVITLDLRMPQTNGLTFLDTVRSICPTTPVIVLSAEASARVAVESIKAGAEACLEKPVDFDALRNELSRLADAAMSSAPPLSLSLGLNHSSA